MPRALADIPLAERCRPDKIEDILGHTKYLKPGSPPRKQIDAGDKVKVTIMFRGREITHPEIAWRLLQRMAELLNEVAVVERQPSLEGRNMFIILSSAQKIRVKEGVQS